MTAPARPRPPTRAAIQRAIRAAQAEGLNVAGVELEGNRVFIRAGDPAAGETEAQRLERRMVEAFGQ